MESLEQYREGLIASTACLAGEVPNKIRRGDEEGAYEKANQMAEIFGRDNFYLELQDHGIDEQKQVNRTLLDFARRSDLPLLATNDAHYASREDAYAHEILLSIQTGAQLSDAKRMRFDGDQFYLKSQSEMKDLFAEVPQAIYNSRAIADRVDLQLELGVPALPEYEIPEGYSLSSYLEYLAHEGKKKRYPKITQEIEERLKYELAVINSMDFAGYFLIVQDFIQHAKKMGIPVGPGRGSAAGSIVSYCLGITDIDPLRYDLLFERFLNPDRVEMPDVDIDFCKDRRDEIIHYVQDKYGEEKVSQVIAFGTIQSKNAIKDVGRVLGLPFKETDRLAKMVPGDPIPKSLPEALDESKELRDYYQQDENTRSHIDISLKLEGLVRQATKHAAGVVIARGELTDYAPLFKDKDNNITTQYEKDTLAQVGLVKMDFLGLKNLTVIDDAVKLIQRGHGITIDFDTAEHKEMADAETYKLLKKGQTTGVFQLEGGGMQNLLRKAKPKQFEDIVAVLALYRPGPLNSGMVDVYIKRKAGKVEVKYDHSDLEPILKDTYGVILYQEQVMRISQVIGNFTMAEADILRKVMGKKKTEQMPAQREKFLKGAEKKGYEPKLAEHIFDQCATFAEYGFNKSHSVAYAVISYRTAYLKAHYPKEYMAALISADMDDTDKVVKYLHETKSMGISVFPPDINSSERDFSVSQQGIIFSLSAIKNVGSALVEAILHNRHEKGPFKSISDFVSRIPPENLNRRAIESLIQAGAFDYLDYPRAPLHENAEQLLRKGQQTFKDQAAGQFSLFQSESSADSEFEDLEKRLKNSPEWSQKEKLKQEKEILGFYLSGHVLDEHKEEIRKIRPTPLSQVEELEDKAYVRVVGVLEGLSFKTSKNNKSYATFFLNDWEGRLEAMAFQNQLDGSNGNSGGRPAQEPIRDKLQEDAVVVLEAEVSVEDGGDKPKLILRALYSLDEAKLKTISSVHLRLDEPSMGKDTLQRIQKILSANHGSKPVFFQLTGYGQKRVVQTSDSYWIEPSPNVVSQLEKLIGGNNVIFSYGKGA
jgi:DNA polymerase-3 subunit alpha